jgi:hypothetical protein
MEAMVRPVEKSCHAFYTLVLLRLIGRETYESSLDNDDDQDDNSQSQVGDLGSWFTERFPVISHAHGGMDSPSDKAQNGSDKEDSTETAKDVRDPSDCQLGSEPGTRLT